MVTGVNIFKLLQVPRPRVPADPLDVLLGVGAAAAHREDGARRRRADHGRRRRADRLLVQPRRHRDLPDDGVAVHRRGARRPAEHRRADLAAGLHGHRLQGRGRRHRRRPGDPRRRALLAPSRAPRRRRPDRRHRPLHVRGPGADELRRQRRRDRAGRPLDRRPGPRAAATRCSTASGRSTRPRCSTTTRTTTRRRTTRRPARTRPTRRRTASRPRTSEGPRDRSEGPARARLAVCFGHGRACASWVPPTCLRCSGSPSSTRWSTCSRTTAAG